MSDDEREDMRNLVLQVWDYETHLIEWGADKDEAAAFALQYHAFLLRLREPVIVGAYR